MKSLPTAFQELGPEQHWVSEALFATLFLLFIGWSFTPFVTTRGKKFYTVVVWTRLLVVLVGEQAHIYPWGRSSFPLLSPCAPQSAPMRPTVCPHVPNSLSGAAYRILLCHTTPRFQLPLPGWVILCPEALARALDRAPDCRHKEVVIKELWGPHI